MRLGDPTNSPQAQDIVRMTAGNMAHRLALARSRGTLRWYRPYFAEGTTGLGNSQAVIECLAGGRGVILLPVR